MPQATEESHLRFLNPLHQALPLMDLLTPAAYSECAKNQGVSCDESVCRTRACN